MIVKGRTVGAYQANCYMIADEEAKVCCLIDPGADAPSIEEMLAEDGFELAFMALTHGHSDHMEAVSSLEKTHPNTPVYMHDGDRVGVKDIGLFHKIDDAVCRSIKEGDVLTIGNIPMTVLHTPGHSKGSVTFQVGEMLVTGDTLFSGSMGRTDMEGGDYEEIMKSLKRLGEMEGNYHVCPGHMNLSNLDIERTGNYYLKEAMGTL